MNAAQIAQAAVKYVPLEIRDALASYPSSVRIELGDDGAVVRWALRGRPEVTVEARVSLPAISELVEPERRPSTAPLDGDRIRGGRGWMQARKRSATIRAIQLAHAGGFVVSTPEGKARGKPGDYLVEGPGGERHPCDRAVFESTYEVVDAPTERTC